MSAIISGNSLGISQTSLNTLGLQTGTAATGRSGEGVYVNAANGNLVVQRQDEILMGRGLDVGVLRTYNSQGLFDGDNNDNWRIGFYRQIKSLSGTPNTAGNTVVRIDADGAERTYRYDTASGKYINTDGEGSYDTLSYTISTSQWTWTDGDSRISETYDYDWKRNGVGKLLSQTDSAGNSLSYTYNASGLLTKVTSANSSSTQFNYTELIYDATVGKTSNLLSIQTRAWNTVSKINTILTRVRYNYDTSNRLSSVTVDLSPDDNSITDGKTYTTNYTYDGTSKRIATLTQSDGTNLTFTYDASNRITSMKDGNNQTTTYAYTSATRTTVTDPLGLITLYDYNANGQLSKITVPAVNGVSATQSFSYNANGDVTQSINGMFNVTVFTYDSNGNQTLQRDALGNTVKRTYNANNQLLTQTTYLVADPDGVGARQPSSPLTTRYIYDTAGKNQLRFVITPEGRVTEYRYDSYGQRINSITYSGTLYSLSGLTTPNPDPTATSTSSTDVPTEAQLTTWVNASTTDKTQSQRTDYTYDFRGQLATQTGYTSSNPDGTGAGTASTTTYVYDQAGQLLKTISASIQSGDSSTIYATTLYTYDGLGRVLTTTNASQADTLSSTTPTTIATTTTSYDDANNKTTITQANGLKTIRSYDRAGRLVSVMQSNASNSNLGKTNYFYDAAGRLRMTQDPTGVRNWMLYDEASRKVAEIDGNGSLTEYVYNNNNQLTQTIAYATAINTRILTLDVNGAPSSAARALTLVNLRPTSSNNDQKSWRAYDIATRLVKTVDASGAVSRIQYDGAGQVVQSIDYATRLTAAQMISLGSNPSPASILPSADATNDRSTRHFYDLDGRLRATLDAQGYLSETEYDSAGRAWKTLAYATVTSANLRASGTLEQLRPVTNAADRNTYTLYDGQQRVVGQIDAEGYLTEFSYDANDNLIQQTRYASALAANLINTLTSSTSVVSLRPTANAVDQTTSNTYDAQNRLSSSTNPQGTLTQYTYDSVGNLLSTTVAANTNEARTNSRSYDLQGRVLSETDGRGNRTTYQSNANGQRIRSTDAHGNSTRYYYDADARLVYTINALGEVTGNTYNALGQRTQTTTYGTRLSSATLSTLNGGLVDNSVSNAITGISNAALDASTTYAYNPDGSLASSVDPLGNVTTYNYNAFGEQSSITLPINALNNSSLTTRFSYDRRGRQTQQTRTSAGLTLSTTQEYDAFGRVVKTIDANGNTRTAQYDRLGRQVQTTNALGASQFTTYDAFDRILTQTDALGNVTRSSYDNATRSTTLTTPEGISVTTTTNRHGQTQSVTDGNGNVTRYVYDANGNLIQTNLPLARQTTQTYDNANRLIQSTDANGIQTVLTYDAANRILTRTVDPSNASYSGLNLVTRYTYDGQGRQSSVTDPNGTVTQYQYDRKGQVTQQSIDPQTINTANDNPNGLNLVTRYSYDAQGRQLSVTDANGNLTEYQYDNLGRRIETRQDPNGLNIRTEYAYDNNDNLVNQTDANGNLTRYAYDANDQLIYTIDPLGNVQQNSYDAAGRITQTTRYAQAISLSGLASALTVSAVQALLTSNAQDQTERSVYDKDGRLTYSVDAVGGVTQYEYDANGNVVQKTAYATTIVASAQANTVSTDSSRDQVTRNVYDAANRLTYSVDAVGAVTQYSYDANGNVVQKTAYATTIAASAQANTVLADSTRDRVTRNVYDAANRLTYSVDAVGAVTQYTYDANGNVTQKTAYATLFGATALSTIATWASNQSSNTNNQVTRNVYDAANRLIYSVDAVGAVIQYSYDANGNVTQKTAYATLLGSTPLSMLANWASIINDARTTRYVFDANGRQVYTIDALGTVTEQQYDALGRAVRTSQYAQIIDTSTLSARPGLSEVASRIRTTEGADRHEYKLYDAGDRLLYHIDAARYVEQFSYDSLGNLLSTTRLANPLPAFQSAPTLASPTLVSITAAVSTLADPNQDQTQSFSYDAAQRLIASSDALGYRETYTYDALGNKTSFTNKLGKTWWYSYDANNRLIEERTPVVELASAQPDAQGNWSIPSLASAALLTRIEYNAFGQVLRRTEAFGRPEQRSTQYTYDQLGRQIKTEFPSTALYDAAQDNLNINGLSGLARRTEQTARPTSETAYNAFGEAIYARDVNGNLSYKLYDARGQVSYEIDAAGYVTGYQRNAYGEVLQLTRFAEKPRLTTTASALNLNTLSSALETTVAHDQDRILRSEYDQLGRVISVIEPTTYVYDSSASSAEKIFYAGKTTHKQYDAFGQLVQQMILINPLNQQWAESRWHYDQLGRQDLSVDALGYRSSMRYDGFGNLLEQTNYARAENNGDTAISDSNDRTVRYVYDRGNRKLSATQVNVEFSAAATATSRLRGDLTTRFAYDALGNLIQTTTADGATTYTYYDALGRTRAVVAPAIASGAMPLSEFQRDAHGNILLKIDYAQGARQADANTYTLAGTDPNNDRRTYTYYDASGHALQTIDAKGQISYNSYDAAGRLAKTWRVVSDNSRRQRSQFQVTRYDALGQIVQTIQPIDGSAIVQENFAYNAFGEVVRKGTNGAWQEYFDYDQAGHLWRTNSGDGIDKISLYNLAGQSTADIRSASSDLKDLRNAAAADGLNAVMRTDTVYDLLGHRIQQIQPERTTALLAGTDANVRPQQTQTVDRWGNVLTLTDARNANWQVRYRYNANNQLIEQSWSDRSATIPSNAAPSSSNYYDALGQMIASTDANGNTNIQTFDLCGNLITERHADGGVVQHQYDLFGQRIQTTDALGNLTQYRYDQLGQLTSTMRPSVSVYNVNSNYILNNLGSMTPTEQIVYNELGQRLRVSNAAGETLHYDYDLRGNLIKTTQPLGQTTYFSYDARNHKTSEFDANGKRSTWNYDYFGLLTAHMDLAGVTYNYSYNNLRQLRSQSNTRGQNLAYQYDGAGQVLQIDDLALKQSTTYRYDLAGNRVYERTQQNGTNYQNQTLSYDAWGRLKSVTGSDVSIGFEYDRVGNRVRQSGTYSTSAGLKNFDYYYAYDGMNRQIFADALNSNGAISETQGHKFRYDLNGNRTQDIYIGNKISGSNTVLGKAEVTEIYLYDAQNRLSKTTRDGKIIDQRYYDLAGRLVQAGPGANTISQAFADAADISADTNLSRYDTNGQLLSVRTLKANGAAKYDTVYSQYDAAGNVLEYQLKNYDGTSYTNTYRNSYLYFDNYQLDSTAVTSTYFRSGKMTQQYDVNGYLTQITDDTKSAYNRKFINDVRGQILYREQQNKTEYQVFANGQVLGRYGIGLDENHPTDDQGNPNYVPIADFNQSYQAIDSKSVSGNRTYVVQFTGESLLSIAQQLYGQSTLWYLIADANGLVANEVLREGQSLVVPTRVDSGHNDYSTFKAYDANKMIGELSPNTPTPSRRRSCIGTILMAIVGVIATIVTAGAAAIALGAAAGGGLAGVFAAGTAVLGGNFGLGAAIFAGALGGAVGSIASQGVAIALGLQDKFSWSAVALGAIGSAVSGGLAGAAPLGGAATSLGNTVARATIGNAMTQGIAVVTGLQKRFDWVGIAAAAVRVGVEVGVADQTALSGVINTALGKTVGGILNKGMSNFASGVAYQLVKGGKIEVVEIAADAFGNAIGDSLVEAIERSSQQQLQLQQAQQQARAGTDQGSWLEEYAYKKLGPNATQRAIDQYIQQADWLEEIVVTPTGMKQDRIDTAKDNPQDRKGDLLQVKFDTEGLNETIKSIMEDIEPRGRKGDMLLSINGFIDILKHIEKNSELSSQDIADGLRNLGGYDDERWQAIFDDSGNPTRRFIEISDPATIITSLASGLRIGSRGEQVAALQTALGIQSDGTFGKETQRALSDFNVAANSGNMLGSLSQQYESGGRGVFTISSGRNDPGGVSYGVHQLASIPGTMANFIASPENTPYVNSFSNLTPGTTAFNQAYLQVANNDPAGFEQVQRDYITRTHYEPVRQYAANLGFDVTDRGVQEALYSQSVQHGPTGNREILGNAASNIGNVAAASSAVQIEVIYAARAAYASQYASASATTQRYAQEVQQALRISNYYQTYYPSM